MVPFVVIAVAETWIGLREAEPRISSLLFGFAFAFLALSQLALLLMERRQAR